MSHRNESLALELLEDHRKIVRPCIAEFSGKEIKTIGDAFLVEFESALDAANCAIRIQSAIQGHFSSAAPERRLRLRIAVHLGDVLEKEGDVYGEGVNIAARILHLARPGGICVSQSVYDQIHSHLRVQARHMGARRLRNIKQKMSVYALGTEAARTVLFERLKLGFAKAALALLALAFTSLLWNRLSVPHSSSQQGWDESAASNRVAVLPFRTITPGGDSDFISEGMTEELIARLSRIRELRVIAPSSVKQYKTSKKTPLEISNELRVGRFIEGSVRKEGERVRINIQLTDARSLETLWSQDFDGKMDEIFDIQKKIASKISSHFAGRGLASLPSSPLESVPGNNPGYLAYLKGKFFLAQRTQGGILKAIDQFEKATLLEPAFAPAYATAAMAYDLLSFYEHLSPQESVTKALPLAEKALRLDPNSAEARLFLAEKSAFYDLNPSMAEAYYRQAIDANPNYSTAHQWYAEFLASTKRPEEARKEMARALELDPLSLVTGTAAGVIEYYSRNYDAAIARFSSTIEMDSHFVLPYYWMGRAYISQGKFGGAITSLKKAVELSENSPMMKAALAYAYAASGERKTAENLLKEISSASQNRKVSSYDLAAVHVALGEQGAALRLLEQAFRERAQRVGDLHVDPYFDPLRRNPRFEAMLRDLNF